MKKRLCYVPPILVLVVSVACLWRDTGDLILSIIISLLGTALLVGLFVSHERAHKAGWGDLHKTGYHREDPRHPRHPAHVDDQDIPDYLEELTAQQKNIQVLPGGDIMLHRDGECYASPFSLN